MGFPTELEGKLSKLNINKVEITFDEVLSHQL